MSLKCRSKNLVLMARDGQRVSHRWHSDSSLSGMMHTTRTPVHKSRAAATTMVYFPKTIIDCYLSLSLSLSEQHICIPSFKPKSNSQSSQREAFPTPRPTSSRRWLNRFRCLLRFGSADGPTADGPRGRTSGEVHEANWTVPSDSAKAERTAPVGHVAQAACRVGGQEGSAGLATMYFVEHDWKVTTHELP